MTLSGDKDHWVRELTDAGIPGELAELFSERVFSTGFPLLHTTPVVEKLMYGGFGSITVEEIMEVIWEGVE